MRLPFKLAEFAPRVLWASRQARDVWEPRIKAVSQAWIEAERASVEANVRPSALQHVASEDLPAFMTQMAIRGLVALPLARVPRVTGYQSASTELQPGQPFDYKVAITRLVQATEWAEAWAKSDDYEIGRLLGTPACCRDFFRQRWTSKRWFDTTVPMSNSGHGMNMLWRWLGIRPVSHLPCSTECPESVLLARGMRSVMPLPERDWLDEILSWPVRYTSYAGQAEITTPILRMNVPTDALAERVEIRYLGTGYPDEGASGIGFPFIKNEQPKPLNFVRQNPADNGFSSFEAQETAHRIMLDYLPKEALHTVLDLGCGDGTLLKKIPAQIRIGVEADEQRAKKARQRGVIALLGDCMDIALVRQIVAANRPELIIAQRFRNPTNTLREFKCFVLSYDYASGLPHLYDFR